MLDVEEDGEVLVDFLALGVGELDVDEDVFAGGLLQEGGELLAIDLDGVGMDLGVALGLAVKHAGDAAGLAHGFHRLAAEAGALGNLKRDCLGHKSRG